MLTPFSFIPTCKNPVTEAEYDFRTTEIIGGFNGINQRLDKLIAVLTRLAEVVDAK